MIGESWLELTELLNFLRIKLEVLCFPMDSMVNGNVALVFDVCVLFRKRKALCFSDKTDFGGFSKRFFLKVMSAFIVVKSMSGFQTGKIKVTNGTKACVLCSFSFYPTEFNLPSLATVYSSLQDATHSIEEEANGS